MPDDSKTPTPFLSDVTTLRKRAREHIEEGAVTPGYGADAQAVCKLLNDALATEIVCVLRYRRHYYMARASTSRAGAGRVPRARERGAGARRPDRASASCSSAASPTSIPTGLLSRSHSEYVEGDDAATR